MPFKHFSLNYDQRPSAPSVNIPRFDSQPPAGCNTSTYSQDSHQPHLSIMVSSSTLLHRKSSTSSIESIASSTADEDFPSLFSQESELVQASPSPALNLPALVPSGLHGKAERPASVGQKFDRNPSKSGHPSNDEDRRSLRSAPITSSANASAASAVDSRKLLEFPRDSSGKHTKTRISSSTRFSRKRARSDRSPSPSSPPKPKPDHAKHVSAFTDCREPKRRKVNSSTNLPHASTYARKRQDKGSNSRTRDWVSSVFNTTSDRPLARDYVRPLAMSASKLGLQTNNTKSEERVGGSISMPPRTLQQADGLHGKTSDEADQQDSVPCADEAVTQDSQEPMSQDSQPLSQMPVDSFHDTQESMPPTSSDTLHYHDILNCFQKSTSQESMYTLPDSQEPMSLDSQIFSQMSVDSFRDSQEAMPADSQSLSRTLSQETLHCPQESLDTPPQSQEPTSQDSQPRSQMSLDTPQHSQSQSQEPVSQDSQSRSQMFLDTPQQSQEPMSRDSQPLSQMSLDTPQQSQEPMSQDSQRLSQMTLDTPQQSQEPMPTDSQSLSRTSSQETLHCPEEHKLFYTRRASLQETVDGSQLQSQLSLDTLPQSQEPMSQDSQPLSQLSLDTPQHSQSQSQVPMSQDSQSLSQMSLDTPQQSQEPMSLDSQRLSQMSLDTPQESQEPMPEDSQTLSRRDLT